MIGWWKRKKAAFGEEMRRAAMPYILDEYSKILERLYGDRVVYSRGVPFGLRERDGAITPFASARSHPVGQQLEWDRSVPQWHIAIGQRRRS